MVGVTRSVAALRQSKIREPTRTETRQTGSKVRTRCDTGYKAPWESNSMKPTFSGHLKRIKAYCRLLYFIYGSVVNKKNERNE